MNQVALKPQIKRLYFRVRGWPLPPIKAEYSSIVALIQVVTNLWHDTALFPLWRPMFCSEVEGRKGLSLYGCCHCLGGDQVDACGRVNRG